MAINNSNKPIGTNVGNSSQKQVGSTYGERRQMVSSRISAEPQVQKTKDFFRSKSDPTGGVEQFSSNTRFITSRKLEPHKVIEAGKAHPRPRINDDVRLSFLDKIIAGEAENRPPSNTKTSLNSRPKLIKA